jgi:deoxyribodipyrimidine photo-lyase
MNAFVPSRAAGLKALERFAPHMGRTYSDTRNYDFGVERRENVSMLSPYIRHRLLSEEEVVRTAIAAHGLKNAEKFVHEVFWRSYWKGWLEQRPSIWHEYLQRLDELQTFQSPDLEAALRGQTGIACFDHWVTELHDTGYLHNHARMWFASIWIFTLRLPWQIGADLFLEHLLDGDPASNTLSWRWVAGLQTLGKHYVADADNIRRFTDGRFSPTGLTVAPEPRPAWPAPAAVPITPLPPLPLGPLALLLTEEDMVPDLPSELVGRIAIILRCPLATRSASLATAFRNTALNSSAEALAADISVPLLAVDHWTASAWLDSLGSYSGCPIVTAFPPVGSLQSNLNMIGRDLANAGAPIHYFRRHWDEQCWPHAIKGFFPFKENIPTILRTIGMP